MSIIIIIRITTLTTSMLRVTLCSTGWWNNIIWITVFACCRNNIHRNNIFANSTVSDLCPIISASCFLCDLPFSRCMAGCRNRFSNISIALCSCECSYAFFYTSRFFCYNAWIPWVTGCFYYSRLQNCTAASALLHLNSVFRACFHGFDTPIAFRMSKRRNRLCNIFTTTGVRTINSFYTAFRARRIFCNLFMSRKAVRMALAQLWNAFCFNRIAMFTLSCFLTVGIKGCFGRYLPFSVFMSNYRNSFDNIRTALCFWTVYFFTSLCCASGRRYDFFCSGIIVRMGFTQFWNALSFISIAFGTIFTVFAIIVKCGFLEYCPFAVVMAGCRNAATIDDSLANRTFLNFFTAVSTIRSNSLLPLT